MFPIDSSAAYRTGAFSNGAVMAPGSDPAALTRVSTAARRNYTPLDLMKYDTPLTSAKVQRMISQLEYKLQLERQFKHGYDKIARLYQAEGDRRSQGDAMNQRTESAGKPVRLNGAVALMTWLQRTVVPLTESVCAPCGVAVTGFTGQSSTSNLPKYPANADRNASAFARAA